MLEYLLSELEKSKEEYLELKKDSVEIAYINAVYNDVARYIKWYNSASFDFKCELKQTILASIAVCVAYYGMYKKPGTLINILGVGVSLLTLICVHDSYVEYKSLVEYREKLKEFGYDMNSDPFKFSGRKSVINMSAKNKANDLNDLESYIATLDSIIKSENISEELKKYPEIMENYLNKEFEAFLAEKVRPEKVDLSASPLINDKEKMYKRVV